MPVARVKTHAATIEGDVPRGGWYNKCQILARRILEDDTVEAERLAHGFYVNCR